MSANAFDRADHAAALAALEAPPSHGERVRLDLCRPPLAAAQVAILAEYRLIVDTRVSTTPGARTASLDGAP